MQHAQLFYAWLVRSDFAIVYHIIPLLR
jgi:hypothetical protein